VLFRGTSTGTFSGCKQAGAPSPRELLAEWPTRHTGSPLDSGAPPAPRHRAVTATTLLVSCVAPNLCTCAAAPAVSFHRVTMDGDDSLMMRLAELEAELQQVEPTDIHIHEAALKKHLTLVGELLHRLGDSSDKRAAASAAAGAPAPKRAAAAAAAGPAGAWPSSSGPIWLSSSSAPGVDSAACADAPEKACRGRVAPGDEAAPASPMPAATAALMVCSRFTHCCLPPATCAPAICAPLYISVYLSIYLVAQHSCPLARLRCSQPADTAAAAAAAGPALTMVCSHNIAALLYRRPALCSWHLHACAPALPELLLSQLALRTASPAASPACLLPVCQSVCQS
jgi:hypothetical protein